MSITPKNWATFQHYKDRSPAWIKLHRGLLDDYAFSRLPVASRALAPLLWLLASEYEAGKITASFDEMAFRFRMTTGELCEALNPLLEAEFFATDSKPLATRKRKASLEKRDIENIDKTEEEKKERSQSSRGAPLPADWLPSNADVSYGAELGLSARQIGEAAEELRLWARANSNRSIGRKADWSSTFKSWMRRNKGKPNAKPTVSEAIRSHIEGGVSLGPKPRLIPIPASGSPPRLLPQGGRSEPGNLHGGDSGDPVRILSRGDPACDGPADGDCAQDQLATDRGRG